MVDAGEPPIGFDAFLSHGAPDKPWVLALRGELEALGLRAFVDFQDLKPGENWAVRLSRELQYSRALVLVLSAQTLQRPWVELEWTSFLSAHGPTSGRLIPVLLDDVALPPFLNTLQALNARHRDPARAARELAERIGRPGELPEGDVRRLYFGQDLAFVLEPLGDGSTLALTDPTGRRREVPAPWAQDTCFTAVRVGFSTLSRQALTTEAARAELHGHAVTLGGLLFGLLFDARGLELLRQASIPGQPRPLLTIRSDEDRLLALPWELLHHDGRFLVREGDLDLARSIPREVGPGALLREPSRPLALVVNVSAPEGSGLNYEAESYRITRTLTDRCDLRPTELGTLDDLARTVAEVRPVGVHFSGHGGPGFLVFEDDEGREVQVPVAELVRTVRGRHPDGQLPPFFYLANCHGNDPAALEAGRPGVESLAARLHREGVAQVVAYSGPILDALSTEAEVALYEEIAHGGTTRYAVRRAREALSRPQGVTPSVYRQESTALARDIQRTHPFAWAQLVLYHRGPDHPLSTAPPGPRRLAGQTLHRTFVGAGSRRILRTGFIGRRRELHGLRRRVRQGRRLFVLQGLGGLGKSTLALHMLQQILQAGDALCDLWCQDAEQAQGPEGIAEALVGQLLNYCRKRFGSAWEQVVQQVDPVDDPAQRFEFYLGTLLGNVERLVLYLDNLESLLLGPEAPDGLPIRPPSAPGARPPWRAIWSALTRFTRATDRRHAVAVGPKAADGPPDPADFGAWCTPALASIWAALVRFARETDKLYVVASCRYRNPDFPPSDLIPVAPLPAEALFRLTSWFGGLGRLSAAARARLVERLEGHPRAVEYANDLVEHALDAWEECHGPWRLPDPPAPVDLDREWDELVAPTLPAVQEKLWDNLLLAALWDRVLDDRARRMIYRMTLLRRPWDWGLTRELGEEGEPPEVAEATARHLGRTSLLEQVELSTSEGSIRRSTIHPATARYVARRFGDAAALRLAAHCRVGAYYETQAKVSPDFDDDIEAGYHLFQAGEYDRAIKFLGPASQWLQDRGRVREGLRILEPFLAEAVRHTLKPDLIVPLLGTVGRACHSLGQVERAIGYHEQQLAIAREIGNRAAEGAALGDLGDAYTALGQEKRAIGYHEQYLAITREVGSRAAEGAALNGLGTAYYRLGQMERAIDCYEQVLTIDREIGNRRSEGGTLNSLGVAYYDLGQEERAISYYEQALTIAREVGSRAAEGRALGDLGIAHTALGQEERAIGYHERRLAIAREIGNRAGEGNALGDLGNAYTALGQEKQAIGYYEQQLAITREVGDRRGEGNALNSLGVAYYGLGQMERAIDCYEQALTVAREIGNRAGEGGALCNLGSAYHDLGQEERAIGLLGQAVRIGREINDPRLTRFATELLEHLK